MSLDISIKEQGMTDKQVEEFRRRRHITVRGFGESHNLIPNPVGTMTRFPDDLVDVIARVGYTEPRPLQSQIWPIALMGIDVYGVAEKGNGAILSYLLPAVVHAKDTPALLPGEGPEVLILVPTLTRVFEVREEVRKFALPLGVTDCAVTGLEYAKTREAKELKEKGAKIVIAVPHSLCSMVSSNHTCLRSVSYLVLDQMDQMLGLHYESQVCKLLREIRRECQTLYFYSKHSVQLKNLGISILRDPMLVMVGNTMFERNPLGRRWVNVSFSADPDPIESRFPSGLSFKGSDGDWYSR